MIYTDVHAHTTYCDGKNTPEQMILSAIEKGMKRMGLVIHSYLDFVKLGSCESIQAEGEFVKEMNALKEKYADKIQVYCGIEMDYLSKHVPKGFDYIIGSVHFMKGGDKYYPIDWSHRELVELVDEVFGGDQYLMAEEYFSNVSNVVEKHNADIIGHFDIITKFNEQNPYFDLNHPRYVSAWQKAIDKLLLTGKPFEINTGAISRGYRTKPYPALDMIEYIKLKGGKLILSSDSHSIKNIAFEYDKWSYLL